MEGTSVSLSCSAAAPCPKLPVQNYTWYKVNGTEMNTVGTGQNLTFNVTESSGSGQYSCEAQNEHGKENSTIVQLDVGCKMNTEFIFFCNIVFLFLTCIFTTYIRIFYLCQKIRCTIYLYFIFVLCGL